MRFTLVCRKTPKKLGYKSGLRRQNVLSLWIRTINGNLAASGYRGVGPNHSLKARSAQSLWASRA